jgi:prepilin signal peptidase PulO-like enzyme (type II secretory pathway)
LSSSSLERFQSTWERRAFGLGDVKLIAVMGLFLGQAVLGAILVALLTGSLFGLALLARHGRAAAKLTIPFGPFLAFGGVVALLLVSILQ